MKKKIIGIGHILVIVITIIGIVPGIASAAVITYIDVNATGVNDGTFWANAYTDLQVALSEVSSDLVVDQQFPEGDQYFDGNRVEVIDAPPEMDEWTIVARVRPTSSMGKIPLETVTSIDFCNGKEIITSLGTSTFIYRNIGETEWKESKITVFQPHSITWSDSLQRYFVADTDNHRIISFAHLDKPFCNEANNPDCSCTGCIDCQPYRETHYVGPVEIPDPDPNGSDGYLCRPHDLEYNPHDGFFYGVTAPYYTSTNCGDEALFCNCGCATDDPDCEKPSKDGERMHTYLFRFKDIDAYGTVEDGQFIDLKDLGIINGRYTRAVTIGDNGKVYVVDSSRPNSGPQEGVYEIINFVASPEEPIEGEDYKYYGYRPGGGHSTLNDVEYFNGWWYGTSAGTPELFRWETWEGFPGNIQSVDLPVGFGTTGYFLTKWQDNLYVAYYGTHDGILRIGEEDNDNEIYVNEDNVQGTTIPSSGTILTNDQSGWYNDVLFGINPDPAIPGLSGKWAVVHHDYGQHKRTHASVECAIEPDQWYNVAASSNGNELKLYINGILQDSTPKNGDSLTFNGVESYIGANGAHINTWPRYFQGDIAYVQMYDRALCDDEILALANQPPDCSAAYANPDCLWPPNHKFVDITIMGVTDPDCDPVTITVTGITSDEPTVTDKGSGGVKHAPDASGIDTATASVRAECSGKGDGRVYVIAFTASDGINDEVQGSVVVKVPHNQSSEDCPAVDSGQNYDATDLN